jgi:hypothetical protein
MSDPSQYGPPGGPLSGGMEAQQDFANDYNRAAQEKQAAIQELASQFAPQERPGPEPQREQEPQQEIER